MITKLLGIIALDEDLTPYPMWDRSECYPEPLHVLPKAPQVAKMRTLFLLGIQVSSCTFFLIHCISSVAMAAAAKNTQLSISDHLSQLYKAHAGHFSVGVGFTALAERSVPSDVAELGISELVRHYIQLQRTVLRSGIRCHCCPGAPQCGQQLAFRSTPQSPSTLFQ